MLSWLTAGYGLAPGDAHLLIGAAAQLDVLTLGGSTAVRIPRATLPKKQSAKLPD